MELMLVGEIGRLVFRVGAVEDLPLSGKERQWKHTSVRWPHWWGTAVERLIMDGWKKER